MVHKENKEIKEKYSIKGQSFKNNCQTFDCEYHDQYFYDKYPISHEVQECHHKLTNDFSKGDENGR